jgi:hypothetical protein
MTTEARVGGAEIINSHGFLLLGPAVLIEMVDAAATHGHRSEGGFVVMRSGRECLRLGHGGAAQNACSWEQMAVQNCRGASGPYRGSGRDRMAFSLTPS